MIYLQKILAQKRTLCRFTTPFTKQISIIVQPVMIEQVLYKKFYNDIAMLIDNKIIILAEHQSTVNENMPLRLLEYVARVYEKVVIGKNKFGRKLVKIPLPEFYVFYNGVEDFPKEKILKLSDAFISSESEYSASMDFPLEITVKVVNINIDKENEILKRCKVLEQYSNFIELVREAIASGEEHPLTRAISRALKQGFLSDYLARKATEVENMLMTEYDYDTDIAVQREEAFNEGISIGISKGTEQAKIETARNALDMNLDFTQICVLTGLSIETIEKIAKENKR